MILYFHLQYFIICPPPVKRKKEKTIEFKLLNSNT